VAPIVVVGSLNMDLVVRVERWPQGGETILGRDFIQGAGGKGANQAASAAALGGAVAMVGQVGTDAFGDALRHSLAERGVDVSAVVLDDSTPTGVALIGLEDSGENRIVVVPGANGALTPEAVERSLRTGAWEDAQVLLLQCEIPVETITFAAQIGKERNMTVVLDPAPPVSLPSRIWTTIDICTPNQVEARSLTGISVRGEEDARRVAAHLRRQGVGAAIIKLGADGVLVAEGNRSDHIAGIRVRAVDTTAAGDVFAGALAVGLAEGLSLEEAVAFANRAAAISTTRPGAQASLPSRAEVDGALKGRAFD